MARCPDGTFFDSSRYNPNWSTVYASDYYAAQTAALTVAPNADLNSGTVILRYRPGPAGKEAVVKVSPAAAASFVTIRNRTTTSARGSYPSFSARRQLGTNTITVSGRVPLGRSVTYKLITIDKPELYAAAVFRAELARAGVTVDGPDKITRMPSRRQHVVGTDYSMTLSQLLVPFMKLSNNQHAEALTKTMGALKGQPGSWAVGLHYTRYYMKKRGASMKGVVLVDGSGVARRNKLSPRALAQVLYAVQREPWFGAFRNSLPVAGNLNRMVGGTLRYRMNYTAAANNARAKTGTLTGVTALSGYVTGADGRRYIFAMLSQHNGNSPRPVEDQLVKTLAGWRR